MNTAARCIAPATAPIVVLDTVNQPTDPVLIPSLKRRCEMYKLMTDERIPTMITGRSLADCWRKLARMLRVDGPRVIEATDREA